MRNLNTYIDHTLLKPEATAQDIEKLCLEALQYRFAAVCLLPCWVEWAAPLLYHSDCKLCSVVGFPLGGHTTSIKAQETQQLVQKGVQEVDMVLNNGWLKSGFYDRVKQDIQAVVEAAQGSVVKVILETCLLSTEEKRIAAQLSVDAGAHFVKTSTGFSKAGATVEDILLLREIVGPDIGVKASGGIRDSATAIRMIQAGATRIGTSSGVHMMLQQDRQVKDGQGQQAE